MTIKIDSPTPFPRGTAMPEPGGYRVDFGPLRVVVIGCGAITQQFHLPVLAGHEGVRLIALVDRDLSRARELAKAYGVATAVADVAELADGSFDAAVIATPPAHHAALHNRPGARGIHILVEKPMALSAAEAVAMVEAAEAVGIVLSVGLFRRLLPSTRLLRAILESGAAGRVTGFSVRSGAFYGWPSATLGNMRRDQAGGGILIDMGSHIIDMILSLLPGVPEVLDYRDNSLGGIESECELRLRILGENGPVEGTVEMSRTRNRPGGIRIECEHATLGLPLGENTQVSIRPRGVNLADPINGDERDYRLDAGWADTGEVSGYAAFREQIDDWLGAIRTGREPQLGGRSVLPTVGLIEECYRRAGRLREPWVEEGLPGLGADGDGRRAALHGATNGVAHGHPTAAIPAEPRGRAGRRVLVTGASGFIGCRVAELLHFRDGWEVRALVNNPANAARLARLPVEMIQGDLRSEPQMRAAIEGCDAVVHCAIGTAYGQSREVFAVTVGGTRVLAEACAGGVRASLRARQHDRRA